MINITIFCSSKNNLNPEFYNQTQLLIKSLDHIKFTIVYGGGTNGLMGTVRKTTLESGGRVITSNIRKFEEPDIPDTFLFDNIDERQQKMVELGDGYLVLPGGYGTCFEMLEVMTKNDIGEQSKPIFVFNCEGIYDNFIGMIENLIEQKLITRNFKTIKVHIESEPTKLANKINDWVFTSYKN
jgi:uncharacterized protein (TIGR00730 family)